MTTTKPRSATTSPDSAVAEPGDPLPLTNLAVLRGTLVAEPTRRELASGSTVVQFDISTTFADGARTASASAPVAWVDPSERDAAGLVTGGEYLVVGSVRRRFFRVGGATQSRTEVVADRVIPVRRRKQVDAAYADVISRLAGG